MVFGFVVCWFLVALPIRDQLNLCIKNPRSWSQRADFKLVLVLGSLERNSWSSFCLGLLNCSDEPQQA